MASSWRCPLDGAVWSFLRSPALVFEPVSGDLCEAETALGAVTVTLPAAPVTRDYVGVEDVDGLASTNAIAIDGNGHAIDGSATISIGTDHARVLLVFDGTEWVRMLPATDVNDGPADPLVIDAIRAVDVASAAGAAGSVGALGIHQASDGAGGFRATSLQDVGGELVSGNSAQVFVAGTTDVRTHNPAPLAVRLASATTGTVDLFDAADGKVYTLDVRVGENDAGATAAAWRIVAIVHGAGGVAVIDSQTATGDGPDAGSFTAPAIVVAGATVKVQVTNPDATARRWGVEASAQVLDAP